MVSTWAGLLIKKEKNCMNAIDTNILVYAFDSAYPQKRSICQKIIENVFEGEDTAVVTNQIIAEFSFVVTKKIEKPLSITETKAIIGAILTSANWKVLSYTSNTVLHALESKQPFWDALIAQTLREQNIQSIITENAKDFSGSGIAAKNPFD